ncbi:MAG: glycosyltransferase [Verrucomicrobiota bacterium]
MSSNSRRPSLDVLIHCPGSHGVVPDQVHCQASALHELGIKVLVLCGPSYTRTRNAAYPTLNCMIEGATTNRANIVSRKVGKAAQTVRNQLRFAWEVYKNKPALVLSASHIDSQSPLWVWAHVLLAVFRKTIYAMNLHFPNRDHHIGPKWWQVLAAKVAFRPFRIAIAHKRIYPSSVIPKHIRTVEVPLGPDPVQPIKESPKAIRKSWKIPRGKKVFLAFGHVRNHKNLDLVIRAMTDVPDACLIIQGRVSNHRDRPLKYYQMLADDLGLSKRVIITDDFVPDEKRQSYFEAADFVVSTYSSGFHSQTATLATAAKARRRVLSSSGSSPMRDLVEHFGLGVHVEPDSSEAVADGMATLLNADLPEPRWEDFDSYATWETNVTRLLEAAADYVARRPTPERQFEGFEDEAVPVPPLLKAQDFLKTKPAKPKSSATRRNVKSTRRVAAPAGSAEEKPAPRFSDPNQPEFPGLSSPAVVNGFHGPLNGSNGSNGSNGVNGHSHVEEPPKKRRGRKPGSKNRPKITPVGDAVAA